MNVNDYISETEHGIYCITYDDGFNQKIMLCTIDILNEIIDFDISLN